MSRFSRYDTDEERLPEGMTRIGYDADEQVYTFRDSDGSIWESAPGNQYGRLTKVSDGDGVGDHAEDNAPFLGPSEPYLEPSWRRDMRPLLNFGVLIGLFLIFLFWFLHWSAKTPDAPVVACADGTSPYTIHAGDTCWDIAEKHGLSMDDLTKNNLGLNCKSLRVNSQICLPNPPPADDGAEKPTV
ncbi:hypothetical protein AK830_g3292 [Neonectria ditissima]|uniref:LysM domain-containing protein n=1 Tax=Neonectria ditissima TaxID=78410 RepID=A0A0P7B986_9HYPO|nr:hypothetical protein AK830_g3292 [Neonectria ditissima]